MTRFEVDDGGKTSRLVSGTNVYGECLYHGHFIAYMRSVAGRPCYQGARDHMKESWIDPVFGRYPMEAFELEIDGQSLHSDWEWKAADSADVEGCTVTVVELENKLLPIAVRVHSRLDGTAFVERWLEVTNKGQAPVNLSCISPMSGLLWRIEDKAEHHTDPQFLLGCLPDVPQLYEGAFQWRELMQGTTTLEASDGRSGWGIPWFCVKNTVSGEVFVGHLEWSSNWRMGFTTTDMVGAPDTSLLFSVGPTGQAPLRVIAPGETITSPVMHLGHFHGDTCAWVQETHTHIRNISPQVTPQNCYIGAGRIVDGELDWLEREVKLAADMGMEYFMVDAGWYGNYAAGWYYSTGDWDVTRFGGSLDKVRALIHSYGMKFGLWLEPESAGKYSKLHKAHPDWPLRRDGRYVDIEGRLLDLSNDAVARFVEDEILKLFAQHGVDYFKIDYNTFGLGQYGENMRLGRKENSAYRYVQHLYRIYDKIAREYPDAYLENCAAGGGRNDLGMVRRCHVSCLSDYAVFPRSIKALNNVSMAIPPERLRFYYRHYPGYHMYGSLETQLRVLMFCSPIFVGFGRDESWVNPDETAVVKKYIDLYKNVIAHILPACRVFHHTPALKSENTEPWCVMEYAGDTQGYAGIFRLTGGSGTFVLRPRGLNHASRYRVSLLNTGQSFDASGAALAREGLPVFLDGALTSEFMLFEEVANG